MLVEIEKLAMVAFANCELALCHVPVRLLVGSEKGSQGVRVSIRLTRSKEHKLWFCHFRDRLLSSPHHDNMVD